MQKKIMIVYHRAKLNLDIHAWQKVPSEIQHI